MELTSRNQEKLFEIHAEEEANVVFNKSLEAFKKYFLKNLIVIFIIGGPGCGKGTQCERLKEAYQLIHISSGDLLREEVTSGSEMGKELQAIMEKGELVPMMTVLTMIRKVMLKAVMSGARGFLIDGYPREKEQGILFESEIHPCQACVYYNVDDATMIQRMRWRSLTSGRADDNDATMKLRLQTFHSHSEPVIAHYR
jgi:adenylate kinase